VTSPSVHWCHHRYSDGVIITMTLSSSPWRHYRLHKVIIINMTSSSSPWRHHIHHDVIINADVIAMAASSSPSPWGPYHHHEVIIITWHHDHHHEVIIINMTSSSVQWRHDQYSDDIIISMILSSWGPSSSSPWYYHFGPAVIGYSLMRSPSRGHVPTVFHYVRLFLSCHVMCCFIGKVYKLKQWKKSSPWRHHRQHDIITMTSSS
jgi:hypothetical protein